MKKKINVERKPSNDVLNNPRKKERNDRNGKGEFIK